MCAFTAVTLVPVVWAILTSFKRPVDAFAVPPELFFPPTFEFHYQVWVEKGFWRYLINSVIVSASVVVVSVSIGSMAAYGLSRLRSRTSRGVLFGILSMRMFPHILLAIPFFVLAKWLGLINTYPALILALIAINQPFTIWLMRSFFLDVPHELYEAAEIDGCNPWQVFARVALAGGAPGPGCDGAVQPAPGLQRVPVEPGADRAGDQDAAGGALAEYGAEDINYWTLSAAAAVGIMLPIVVFMMFLQRHLVRGLAFGAVKG